MKKQLIFSFVFAFVCQIACAQFDQNNAFNDLHINSSSSGDLISKNLSDGTANINIPIYSYATEGLITGVSLSYYTGGLQVDEIPSNIGLGWTLNIGGLITRQVRGAYADEKGGYWFSNVYDKEADIFYFNINGRPLKVIFASNSNDFITIPNSDIKIKRYVSGGTLFYPGMGGSPGYGSATFLVIDEQGNEYEFISGVVFGINQEQWVLASMKNYEGKIITYNYAPSYSSYYEHEKRSIYQKIGVNTTTTADAAIIATNVVGEDEYTSRCKLTSIDYPNGTSLVFSYATTVRCDLPGDYALSSIQIKESNPPSGVTAINYTYSFDHAYFASPSITTVLTSSAYPTSISSEVSSCTTPGLDYRLKLKAIKLAGYDATIAPVNLYTFEYMNFPLPQRVFGGRDRFGYANNQIPSEFFPCKFGGSGCTSWTFLYTEGISVGTTFNNSTTGGPTGGPCNSLTSSGGTFGSSHASSTDVNIVGASLLKKITNQASGEISILYKSLFGDFSLNGGVIIDEIKYYDGYSHENDYSYKYDYADGAHILNGIATEGGTITWAASGILGCSSIGSTTSTYNNYFDNTFNIINTGLSGSRYRFKTVTESLKNNTGSLVGKTVYTFSGVATESAHGINTSSYLNPSSYTGLAFQMNSANKQYFRDWTIGLPLTTTTYDMNNNITKSVSYTYSISTNHNYTSQYMGIYLGHGAVDTYYPFDGKASISSIVTRNYYSNTGYTERIVNMLYSGNDLLRTSYINSEGQTIHEYNRYNYAISTTNAAINHLTADGLHRVIYKDKWMEMSSATLTQNNVSGQTIVSGDIIRPNYNYFLKTPATPLVSVSSPGTYYADIASMSGGGAVTNYKLAGGVTRYDDLGLPVEASDLNTTAISNTYNATIFDNERGHLLASASNAKHREIAYSGFESDYTFSSPYIRGNWDFVTSNVSTDHALLGRCSYHCTSSAGLWSHTSTAQLIYGKQYTVSFWVYGSGSAFANDGGSTTVWTPAVATYTIPGTSDVWTLHKGTFTFAGTGSTVGIGVWGDGYIDELKVYPSDCIMETHCYLPIKGKVADVDANDNITSYEYDNYGNVFLVRDFNGNILSKSKTVVQGY